MCGSAGMGDMAVSNSIGSNIFDILLGLGFPWALRTLVVDYGSTVSLYLCVCGYWHSLILSLTIVDHQKLYIESTSFRNLKTSSVPSLILNVFTFQKKFLFYILGLSVFLLRHTKISSDFLFGTVSDCHTAMTFLLRTLNVYSYRGMG